MKATIWHNPKCGTSRKTLAILEESPGVEIKIADNGEVFYRSPGTFVEYYKNPESTASTISTPVIETGDS